MDGVKITPKLAEVLQEMARKYVAYGWPQQSQQVTTRFYPEGSTIFINRSGEEIPAYGCMQAIATIEEDGRTIFEVIKPDAATLTSENLLLFNGSRAVADDENGSAQIGPIVKALKDTAETEDTVGNGWGYTDAEWYLSPGGALTYYGTTAVGDDVILVKTPSGPNVSYFVLAEDAVELPVYAYPGELNETTGDIDIVADSTPFELWYSNQSLSSPERAQSGYSGHYGSDDAGRRVFTFGPCVSGCTTSASITPGSPPAGTEGVAYSHTVTVSGLNGSGVAATGLPAGLSINSGTGAITGTPTTAGTYWVAFTGTTTDTPACNLTRVAKIVIAEAA